eukprot:TRINITY_DN18987_c0_g1_i1.p1 TRINITY_DN18987_c0_g1~~TRINITY_DN18987_c0_g1_i1.p1  ORF type:complete len:272 (+),score=53.00 TRINITY_DN18987_c0_g1_i1:31-846(+)
MGQLKGEFSACQKDIRKEEPFIKTLKGKTEDVKREIQLHKACLQGGGSQWIVSILGVDGISMSLERCETDLRECYRSKPTDDPPTLRRILSGVLSGVKHIHQMGVIHRDLKPENILLSRRSLPLICDFGGAVEIDHTNKLSPLSYCTLKYSSIECLFGDSKYTKSVDYWSVGMIMGFLLLGRDVVQVDEDSEIGVAMAVRDIVGWSPESDWAKNLPFGFLASKNTPSNYPDVGNWNTQCSDLLRGLLSPDPSTRLDCDAALAIINLIDISQ